MDADTTAAAFAIEPETPGEIQVDGRALTFTPDKPLTRGAAYQFAVNDTATGQNGKKLAAPVSMRFTTVGFLQVTSTQPAADSEEVSVDSPITVIFNRPVVPLTGISQQADLPQPLVIQPEVAGTGEWLNTSIYKFTPETALGGATEYEVTIPAGLMDTTGGLLAEDYVFSFRTADPVVSGFAPDGRPDCAEHGHF